VKARDGINVIGKNIGDGSIKKGKDGIQSVHCVCACACVCVCVCAE
jgi:hypothetical protein